MFHLSVTVICFRMEDTIPDETIAQNIDSVNNIFIKNMFTKIKLFVNIISERRWSPFYE